MRALLARCPARLAWACFFGLAWAEVSRAQEPQRAATLHWVRMDGAERCADGIALSRAVDAKLGREVFGAPSAAELVVEARVEPTERGFRAQVRLLDERGGELGSREVLSSEPDCHDLVDAVAVVLAALVDPDGALASSTPTTAASDIVVGPAAPAPPSAVTPEVKVPPCPTRTPEYGTLRAEANATMFARLALGQMPRPAYGFGLAVEVAVPGWGGARLEGAAFLDQTSRFERVDARARFRMLYGGFALCPLWLAPRTRLRVSLCAGAQVGVIHARSFATARYAANEHADLLLQVDASGRASYRLWREWAVHAGASMVVPVRRTLYEAQLEAGRRQTLFEPRSIAGSFDLGFGAHF